jgi:hypothetical protein
MLPVRRLPTMFRCVMLVCAIGLLLMVPASYVSYTSIGLDQERPDGDAWVYTYYRVRWPGDGSFFIGRERQRVAPPSPPRPPDVLDPAAAFSRRASPHPAKRGAFCLLRAPWDDGATDAIWIGMPSVVPFLLVALPTLAWRIRARRRDVARAENP